MTNVSRLRGQREFGGVFVSQFIILFIYIKHTVLHLTHEFLRPLNYLHVETSAICLTVHHTSVKVVVHVSFAVESL